MTYIEEWGEVGKTEVGHEAGGIYWVGEMEGEYDGQINWQR